MTRPHADPGATRAARAGTAVAVVLLAATFLVPHVFSWDVVSLGGLEHAADGLALPPLRSYVDVVVGPASVAAVLVGLLGWLHLPRLGARLGWRALLLTSYGVSLAWLLSLALVGGTDGISRVQDYTSEYLPTARGIDDFSATLHVFASQINGDDGTYWATHVAGHPPGALLFFVVLVRLGIGGSLGVGLVMTAIAATTAPATLVALRALGAEDVARRVAPFLVLVPGAVLMAVSADAVFGAVAAWGLACLALAATRSGRGCAGWGLGAGLLLGYVVMMSYGLVLMGPVALAVLAGARSWRPLPWAVGGALLVVAAFGVSGFWWWDGFGPLHDRYWAGVGAERPQAYWFFGDLGALLVSAGPVLGAALACALPGVRRTVSDAVGPRRTAVLLALGAAVAVLLADLSRMSKAEVERIWLPFVPWLLVSTALLPERWRRPALLVQVVVGLLLQHLAWTEW